MYGCKLLGCVSLKSVNTNQWPINNRQNLAILCTKRLTVVHQTLFSATTKKNGKKRSGHARLYYSSHTVFSRGRLSYQIIDNALLDYTCIKSNRGTLVVYSVGLLVSRSQTNLRASCLLIVPIISKPTDKHRGGA